jgi:hypothetical protein
MEVLTHEMWARRVISWGQKCERFGFQSLVDLGPASSSKPRSARQKIGSDQSSRVFASDLLVPLSKIKVVEPN